MAKGYGLAGQIDSYLKSKGSPLAGMGSVFVASGKKYGVDPRLVVGISGAESSFGKFNFQPFNAWGWMSGDRYGSWQQSINVVTRGLANGYISQGLQTPAGIVRKYAPASAGNDESVWSGNVSTFMKELGASPALATAKTTIAPTPTAPPVSAVPTAFKLPSLPELPPLQPSTAGLRGALISNLALTAQRGHSSGQGLLQGVLQGQLSDTQADEAARAQRDAYEKEREQYMKALQAATAATAPTAPTAPDTSTVPTPSPTTTPVSNVPAPADPSKWAKLAPGADRSGVTTHQSVLDAVAKIGMLAREPLTITTGTNHNQYVINTNRESQHWQGNAADIVYGHGTGSDNIDPALTRLGRKALIAAGMPWEEAAKINGGAFNVGGWNILFNTYVGGNHYNHLHVGI